MKTVTRLSFLTVALSMLISCGSSEPIVAEIGDKKITKKQFDSYLSFKRIDASDTKQREAHLKIYLERETLSAAIENTQLLDEALIEAELQEFKKEMLVSRYFEKHLKDQVSDEAIRGYYAANAAKFESKKAKVAHVLIRTQKDMSETERTARYTRASEVYSKLKSGTDFAEIATEYSEDTISGKKGGVIGWINEGAVDPVFSKTVFTELEKGQISEPIQTGFGFHVVKLLEEPSIVRKPLESVKGDIRYQLRKKVRQAETERLLSSLSVSKK
jgi:peptidyl-prolyl cis-trans isomerase C